MKKQKIEEKLTQYKLNHSLTVRLLRFCPIQFQPSNHYTGYSVSNIPVVTYQYGWLINTESFVFPVIQFHLTHRSIVLSIKYYVLVSFLRMFSRYKNK